MRTWSHRCGCTATMPCAKALKMFGEYEELALRRHLATTIVYDRSIEDPGWAEESASLARFLAAPRTWPELNAWAALERVGGQRLRERLAWLEARGLAEGACRNDGRVEWRATEPAAEMTAAASSEVDEIVAAAGGES